MFLDATILHFWHDNWYLFVKQMSFVPFVSPNVRPLQTPTLRRDPTTGWKYNARRNNGRKSELKYCLNPTDSQSTSGARGSKTFWGKYMLLKYKNTNTRGSKTWGNTCDAHKGSHPLKKTSVLWKTFTNGGGSARFHTLIQKFKGSKWHILGQNRMLWCVW